MALGAVNGNFVPVCLRQSFKQICLVLKKYCSSSTGGTSVGIIGMAVYNIRTECVGFFTRKQPVNKKKPLNIEVVSFKLNFTFFAMGL